MANRGMTWMLSCIIAILLAIGGDPAGAQSAAKKEILIGYSISLTGKFSTEGSETHRSYQMWADEVNQQGGIAVKDAGGKLPVKLIYYDDASDTNNAIKSYERLITKDEVDLILSPWGSGHNFAVTPLTDKYKYPVLLSSAAADAIFQRGFKHVFEVTQLSSNMYNAYADYLASVKDRIQTIALVYENFLFTQTVHDAVKPKLEKAGIRIVADEQYPLGGQDFTSMLTKIRAAKPDAVLLINIMPSSVYATRQMNELGIKPKFYGVNIGPMYTEEFIGKLGAISEGVVENGFWHPDLPFDGAKAFYERYETKYKKKPSTDAAYAYIGTQVLQQAIEQAGTLDRARITDTLHSGAFNTIFGRIEYDEKGINKNQMTFLVQVQDGKRVLVWPKEFTKSELRLAP